jgi:hypothetical protein
MATGTWLATHWFWAAVSMLFCYSVAPATTINTGPHPPPDQCFQLRSSHDSSNLPPAEIYRVGGQDSRDTVTKKEVSRARE